jgi:hypothetical protein
MKFMSDEIPVSIEVSAAEVIQGIHEINGVLTCVNDALIFSYRNKAFFRGNLEVETVRIPFLEIREIQYRNHVFAPRIVLKPRRLRIMESIPGASREEIVFKLKRRDLELADGLVSFVKYRLFELGATNGPAIPFKLPNTDFGLTEHSGLIYQEEEFIVFEIQSGVTGGSKNNRHTIKVEPKAIKAMYLEKGAVTDRLVIKPKQKTLLEVIPGDFQFEIKLAIPKRYRASVEKLLAQSREVEL